MPVPVRSDALVEVGRSTRHALVEVRRSTRHALLLLEVGRLLQPRRRREPLGHLTNEPGALQGGEALEGLEGGHLQCPQIEVEHAHVLRDGARILVLVLRIRCDGARDGARLASTSRLALRLALLLALLLPLLALLALLLPLALSSPRGTRAGRGPGNGPLPQQADEKWARRLEVLVPCGGEERDVRVRPLERAEQREHRLRRLA